MQERKLKVEYIKVDDLKPYSKNSKVHDRTNIEAIKKSIEKYGFNDAIGIWGKQNIVVEGHGRLLACKELGIEEVPCIRLDHLTEQERREYTLLHNKTTMMTDFDYDLLSEELADLNLSEFELDWGIVQDEGFGTDFELPSGDQKYKTMTFTLSKEQEEFISNKISEIQKTEQFKEYQEYEFENKNRNGNALYLLLKGLDK